MEAIKQAALQLEHLLADADNNAHPTLPQLRGLASAICKNLQVGKFAPPMTIEPSKPA